LWFAYFYFFVSKYLSFTAFAFKISDFSGLSLFFMIPCVAITRVSILIVLTKIIVSYLRYKLIFKELSLLVDTNGLHTFSGCAN